MKGYINEMAICLEDEDERISNLAKLFFHELSKKGRMSTQLFFHQFLIKKFIFSSLSTIELLYT